jgi:hypothetical protein
MGCESGEPAAWHPADGMGEVSKHYPLPGGTRPGAQEQEQGAVGQVDASAVAMVECRDVDLAACGAETVREHAGHLRQRDRHSVFTKSLQHRPGFLQNFDLRRTIVLQGTIL